MVDLFATSLNHRLPMYFSPMVDPQSAVTDAMLQWWAGSRRMPSLPPPPFRPDSAGSGQGSAVQGSGAHLGGSIFDSAPLVPGPSGASGGDSLLPATKEGSSQTSAFPPLQPESPNASADCLSFVERSARHFGFSKAVAHQLTHCHRESTRINYQAKWSVYRSWCHHHGHSISCPTVSKVADFLLYLRCSLSFSYLPIASYHSMLSGVFRFVLPDLSSHFILHDLLRLFRLERPLSSCVPPWDLLSVLCCFRGSPFNPLDSCSLCDLTQKVLFLVSCLLLVGLVNSRRFPLLSPGLVRIYISRICRSFVRRPNPPPILFLGLSAYVCCVTSLETFLMNCCAQFVLSGSTSLVLLFFLRVLVLSLFLLTHLLVLFLRRPLASSFVRLSLRLLPLLPLLPRILLLLLLRGLLILPRPRSGLSVCGVATSVAFVRNAPLSSILAAATWSSSAVFTSFYLRDNQFSFPRV